MAERKVEPIYGNNTKFSWSNYSEKIDF